MMENIAPIPENSQVTNHYTEKKNKGCLTYLLIVLGIFTALLIFAFVTVYISLIPRFRLGNALVNTIVQDSLESSMNIDNFDENIKSLNLKLTKDINKTVMLDIEMAKKGASTNLSVATLSNIFTDEYHFIKADHTDKNQILNQILSYEPGLDGSKPLETIKPVLFGDYWFRETSDFSFPDEMPSKFILSKLFAFGTLMFDIKDVDKHVIDGEEVYTYTLSPQENFTFSKTMTYQPGNSDTSEYISGDTFDRLGELIQNTKDFEDTEIIIQFTSKNPKIRSIKVSVPPLGNESMLTDIQSTESLEMSMEDYIIQKLIIKTHSSGEDLTELFSLVVAEKDPTDEISLPDKVIDMKSLDEQTQDLVKVIVGLFISNQELFEDSQSQTNQFSTKTHETKLLFDKGEYDAMLRSAQELLTLYNSDREKAIAHYWLGLAHYKMDNIVPAKEALNEAIKIDENYAAPYVTLGAIAYTESEIDVGLSYSLKCAELDPEYAWCYNNIGVGYLYKEDYETGVTYLEKAVELDPVSFVFADNLNRARKYTQ